MKFVKIVDFFGFWGQFGQKTRKMAKKGVGRRHIFDQNRLLPGIDPSLPAKTSKKGVLATFSTFLTSFSLFFEKKPQYLQKGQKRVKFGPLFDPLFHGF